MLEKDLVRFLTLFFVHSPPFSYICEKFRNEKLRNIGNLFKLLIVSTSQIGILKGGGN